VQNRKGQLMMCFVNAIGNIAFLPSQTVRGLGARRRHRHHHHRHHHHHHHHGVNTSAEARKLSSRVSKTIDEKVNANK
jgi:hypothetical protein